MEKTCPLEVLEEKVSNLMENSGSPQEYLDTVMQLQFFRKQSHICEAFTWMAYSKLLNSKDSNFETYHTLAEATKMFLTKDEDYNAILTFASKKKKQIRLSNLKKRFITLMHLMKMNAFKLPSRKSANV